MNLVNTPSQQSMAVKLLSNASFLKTMDDTEYLAWRLPVKYEKELEAKKAEFKIKN